MSYQYLITGQGGVLLLNQDDNVTYQETIIGPECEKWLKAMKYKLDYMYTNQFWTLVEPFVGFNPIGCKQVFKKNADMDCKVRMYKAQMVTKGYKKIHGVNYDETFSPFSMLKYVRILLDIVSHHCQTNDFKHKKMGELGYLKFVISFILFSTKIILLILVE